MNREHQEAVDWIQLGGDSEGNNSNVTESLRKSAPRRISGGW